MKRIFYYSGYRLTVFHWLNEKLVDSYAFNPGEEGLEKFKTYLLATENTPVRILVDLIEEDFKKETIPHVGAADRKNIVSRLVERHYRKSRDYVHSKVIGREKQGRRDDILLYSVLSNPEILDPWLKPINETGTVVSGIWSLPQVSHKVFSKLNDKSQNVLLVSQQVPSNLRQTFFKNGRFDSSRSAVVNLDDASIGEYISTEVDQTIRFLSNQRQIGFDEKIEVHIICREVDFDVIQSHCSDTNLIHYHYHNIADIDALFKCNTHESEYCSGLYSFVCAAEPVPIGHYGNKSLFYRYYAYLLSHTLYAASALTLLISLIMSFSFISDSEILDSESITLNDKAYSINRDYQKKLAPLEDKLKLTDVMQSSVLFYDKVIATKAISPQNFMVDVSRIFNAVAMRRTTITMLKWRQNQTNNFPTNLNSNTQLIDYGKAIEINHLAVIDGFIRISQNTLKESVDTTDYISSAFRNSEQTIKLDVERLPVDVRPESTIENEKGSNVKQSLSIDQSKGKFKIKVIMKGEKSS